MVHFSVLACVAALSTFALPAFAGPVRNDGLDLSAKTSAGFGDFSVLSCAVQPGPFDSDYATGDMKENYVATLAARPGLQPMGPNAGSAPSSAGTIATTQYVPVCVITEQSQLCIAAGNAFCSPKGMLNPIDQRCARFCNCVRL